MKPADRKRKSQKSLRGNKADLMSGSTGCVTVKENTEGIIFHYTIIYLIPSTQMISHNISITHGDDTPVSGDADNPLKQRFSTLWEPSRGPEKEIVYQIP